MKKYLLLAMLTATVFAYGQNNDLYKWANKSGGSTAQGKTALPTPLKDAGILLNKSATCQYVALGFAGAAAGLALSANIIGTKDYGKVSDLDKIESDRKLRRGLYIGSGVFAAIAVCVEIAAIDYKTRAGNQIKLYSTGAGGGLAYTF